MKYNAIEFEENKPFAHMFFFQLSDTSKDLVRDFVELCVKYLSGYPGQEHFSVGYRALEMERNVNAKNFEVAIHMIFKDFNSYQSYSESNSHNEFITHSAGMSPSRIVYDSFLHYSILKSI